MFSLAFCGSSGLHRRFLFPQPSLSGEGRHLQDEKALSIASLRHRRRRTDGTLISSKPPSAELSGAEEEWLKKLPEKKKALYSHSLPCIEAWLKNLGFYQSSSDRAVWVIERPDWHAQLSLDVTDLYVRYLRSGPGSIEKDVERRFSYALSREDIENAILGGP